jgi:type I restriction enzyme S subunit
MTWEVARSPLGNVLKRSIEAISLEPTQTYQQITVRLRHRGVVSRGTVLGAEVGSTRQYRAKAGQLILSRIDARHGAIGLVPESLDGAVVSNDFWLFDIDESRVFPKFIDYYVGTPEFVQLCRQASEGTTNRVRLQPEQFLALPIPVPSLSEQRQIVARIEELASKIEEARQLKEAMSEELESLVVSTHLHLANGAVVRLGEVLTLDEQKVPVVPGRQYPQVGVRGFGRGLFPRETLESTDTTYKAFNQLYSGAIVLSQVKGWEGAIAVCPPGLAERYVSPEYRTFRCVPDKALPEYTAALVATPWFHSFLKTLTRGVGARRERARPEKFLQLNLPMPSVRAQQQALEVFRRVREAAFLKGETQAELDALLPAVLDRAFRGEL